MDWWTAFWDGISKVFGLGEKIAENQGQKIPMKEPEIREKAITGALVQDLRQDKLQDRELREEPKTLEFYNDQAEYVASLAAENKALYHGSKEVILIQIEQDPANVLTRKQAKQLRKLVEECDKLLYVIKVHPLTIHIK